MKGFAYAVKSARHKRVVLNRICKYHEFSAAYASLVACEIGNFLDDFAHHFDCVHVYAGFCGGDVYRRAEFSRACKRFRNGKQKFLFEISHSFLHKRRVSADKVYSDFLCAFVECFCHFDASARFCRNKAYRSYAYTFVYDRDSEFALNVVSYFYKVFSFCGDFFINTLAGFAYGIADAIQKRYAHRNGPDVKVLRVYHAYGL